MDDCIYADAPEILIIKVAILKMFFGKCTTGAGLEIIITMMLVFSWLSYEASSYPLI
jgi:hypothetical protein